MHFVEYSGINSFIVGMAQVLLKESVIRETRGYKCYELPNPIVIKINNPTSRIVTLGDRRWNCFLPYIESLWLALGRNDMEMIGHYLPRMYDFSDDKQFMRAAYGPRLRFFDNASSDYKKTYLGDNKDKYGVGIDQFKFVEECFNRDPFTRQAVMTILDPTKDFFEEDATLKNTKDFPCTCNIQFLRKGDTLDMIVHMRSNDFFWGASAVNIFNYTFIQEYFSRILNLKIGAYYHIVNNLHFYENFKYQLELLSVADAPSEPRYEYEKKFNNLKDFDSQILKLEDLEDRLRKQKGKVELEIFEDDFFNDWAKVIFLFHTKSAKDISFVNPALNIVTENFRRKASLFEN